MRLLMAVLVAVAGCGGCGGTNAGLSDARQDVLLRPDSGAPNDGGPDDGPPDSGGTSMQLDAGECSAPRCIAVPPPTHTALVAYDEFVASADLDLTPYGGDAPFGLFLDEAGVASVGGNYFRRLGLEGELLSSVRNPRREGGKPPVDMDCAVQYPGGFGVIVSDYLDNERIPYLCRINDDTWPDLSTCTVLQIGAGRPVLTWSGTTFEVLSTEGVASYDNTGVFIQSLPLGLDPSEGPLAAQHTAEKVVINWSGRDSKGCYAHVLRVLPRSYDLSAAEQYDLEPLDFVSSGLGGEPVSTRAGGFAAFLSSGECLSRDPIVPGVCEKRLPTWPASFLSVVGADGQPALLRQPLPVPNTHQFVWDGENLVAIDAGELFLSVYVFDLQGTVLRLARVSGGLGLNPFNKTMGIARIVAVAPNDYILMYSVRDTGELWVSRFQLVPM